MRGGVNLHSRTEHREVSDADRTDVEHHAIEIEEHALAETDVVAVVAVERWLHSDGIAAAAEQLAQYLPSLLYFGLARRIEGLAQSRARERAATSSGSVGS